MDVKPRHPGRAPRRLARIHIVAVAIAALSSLWVKSDVAGAATYSATATVALVRSHLSGLSQDWFQLTGVTSLGTCPTYGGLVLFVLKDDDRSWRHFAMVLNAKRSGAALSAFIDDTVLAPGGFCYLQYLQE